MPTYRVTGPDGQKYRVTAPEGATEEQVMSRVKAQASGGQAKAQQRQFQSAFVPPFLQGLMPEQRSLFQNGATANFSDRIAGVGNVLANAVTAPFSDKVDFNPAKAYNEGRQGQRDTIAAARRSGGTTGVLAEAAGASVPLLLGGQVAAAGKAAPMLAKATQLGKGLLQSGAGGALFGVGGSEDLTNVRDVANNALSEGGKAIAGDLAGRGILKAGGALLRGVSRTPIAQRMADRGITPTLGDSLGGRFKNFESRMSKMPIVGGGIRSFQADQYGQMLRSAADEVLAPIGKSAPSVPAGRELYGATKDLADDAYRQALQAINGPVDDGLRQGLASAAGSKMSTPQREAFNDILDNEILPRMETGQLDGDSVQAIKEVLDSQIKGLKSQPGHLGTANALRKVREELLSFVERASPDGGAAYRNARATYGRAKTLQKAVEASKTDGIPTALQFANAVKQSSRFSGGDVYARGVAPLQGLADDAAQMLPTAIPDPGTAGQLGLLNLLAHPLRYGVPAVAGAGAGALYTKPGNAALQSLLFNRPDLLRRLGQGTGQIAAPAGTLGAAFAIGGQ